MKNDKLKLFLNNFEIYIATVCFFVLTIMLFLQVVSRYLFKYSFTWMEEWGTIMFVYMTYLGISGAVTQRKHLRIDFLLDMMPFKMKRMVLILSNVVFAAFNVFISIIMFDLIKLLGTSVTTILRLPKAVVYAIIPIGLLFSIVRLVQDTIKLTKESAADLGASKPSLDLTACEREYEELLAAQKAGGVK